MEDPKSSGNCPPKEDDDNELLEQRMKHLIKKLGQQFTQERWSLMFEDLEIEL